MVVYSIKILRNLTVGSESSDSLVTKTSNKLMGINHRHHSHYSPGEKNRRLEEKDLGTVSVIIDCYYMSSSSWIFTFDGFSGLLYQGLDRDGN